MKFLSPSPFCPAGINLHTTRNTLGGDGGVRAEQTENELQMMPQQVAEFRHVFMLGKRFRLYKYWKCKVPTSSIGASLYI